MHGTNMKITVMIKQSVQQAVIMCVGQVLEAFARLHHTQMAATRVALWLARTEFYASKSVTQQVLSSVTGKVISLQARCGPEGG